MSDHTVTATTPLSVRRGLRLPAHLEQALRDAPVRTVTGSTGSRYLVPDFTALFPADGRFATQIGQRRDAHIPAELLYNGVDLTFDMIRDCAGVRLGGAGLDEIDTARLDFAGLDLLLPPLVVAWLGSHPVAEAAAWTAMLLAEVQMHGVALATGRFPSTHSTGSAMALHLALDAALADLGFLAEPGEEERRSAFEERGGPVCFNVMTINLLRHLLFEDHAVLRLFDARVAEVEMSSRALRPEHWFRSFDPSRNPWIAPWPELPQEDRRV